MNTSLRVQNERCLKIFLLWVSCTLEAVIKQKDDGCRFNSTQFNLIAKGKVQKSNQPTMPDVLAASSPQTLASSESPELSTLTSSSIDQLLAQRCARATWPAMAQGRLKYWSISDTCGRGRGHKRVSWSAVLSLTCSRVPAYARRRDRRSPRAVCGISALATPGRSVCKDASTRSIEVGLHDCRLTASRQQRRTTATACDAVAVAHPSKRSEKGVANMRVRPTAAPCSSRARSATVEVN